MYKTRINLKRGKACGERGEDAGFSKHAACADPNHSLSADVIVQKEEAYSPSTKAPHEHGVLLWCRAQETSGIERLWIPVERWVAAHFPIGVSVSEMVGESMEEQTRY